MHDHNKNDNANGEHKGMMWMMLICCLVPVLLLFGGVTFFKSVGLGWIGIVFVVGFLVFHFGHMSNKHDAHKSDVEKKVSDDSSDHKSCCH